LKRAQFVVLHLFPLQWKAAWI